MATAAPPLPPGYQLDQPSTSAPPPLPPGYTLDSGQGDQKPQPGFLDKDIPLDSYGNATLSGVQSIGRGLRGAFQGIEQTIAHPIDTLKGVADLPSQAAQVPGAIKDINASPDPTGTYAKVAQETAGQGAGQALLALGTDGLIKGATSAPVRGALSSSMGTVGKVATAVGDSIDPDVAGLVSPRTAHALRLSQKVGRVATKLAGDSSEAAPASTTPLGPAAPSPDLLNSGNLRTASTPAAAPASQTGEALATVPRGTIAEQMKPQAAPEATPAKPTIQRGVLQQQLEDALGAKKLQPNVPLKMQSQVPAAAPEHMGQFARANGLDLHQTIPDSPAGDVLRAKIHDLSNVQVRQLAINAGEDTGQTPVTNAKNSGGMTRQDALGRILAKHPPEEIGQMIDQGQHLPPVQRGALADQVKPVTNNASGESAASQEAMNRVKSERNQGIKRVRIDTRSGNETPIMNNSDAVDLAAGPYDVIELRHPDGTTVIQDQGAKARPYRSKTLAKP